MLACAVPAPVVASVAASFAAAFSGVGDAEGAPPHPASAAVERESLSLASGEWDMDSRLTALNVAVHDPVGAVVCGAWGDGGCGSSTASRAGTEDWGCGAAFASFQDGSAASNPSGPSCLPSMFVGRRGEAMQARAVGSFSEALPDVLPPEPQPFVDTRASSAFIEGSEPVVKDGAGQPICWPWDERARSGSHVPRQQPAAHRTDSLRQPAMNASCASGDMGRSATGVKHWRSFCSAEQTPSDRPIDPNAPLWVKLQEELLAMQFLCALVEDRAIAPSSAACYFGQVQGWHAKEHGVKLASGMKLSRLPAMLKGLKRVLGEGPRRVRRGIAPQALRSAMDRCLDPRDPAHANIRAALATALQGLLRSAEFACDPGVAWNPARHLSRADVVQCTPERLVLMMIPCKNMRHLNGKTVPLVIGGGGALVDAAWEVANMLRVDPVSWSDRGSTPLFRDPSTNQPLRTSHLRDLIRVMMAGEGEDPSEFGTHSLRIGGATALFAAGADETVIRTMGRWSSDCYRLYVRACYEATLKWTTLAGSTQVHDLAGQFDEVDFY